MFIADKSAPEFSYINWLYLGNKGRKHNLSKI